MSNLHTNEKLAVVEWCKSHFAASALVALLQEYDIKSYGPDGPLQAIKPDLPGPTGKRHDRFPVFVLESQLELARLTITDVRADASEINWDEVDVGERLDKVPLKEVRTDLPTWLKAVAITGLLLLLLIVISCVAWMVF